MKTVLIVEDEKMIRQGIRTMVQRSGVPVEVIMECSNGEMALDILKEHHIDVMFTDIRMPKMDGIELVQRIQELEHKPQIVAISGFDDFTFAVEMLRNGVREYILKPVEREKIVEILQKLDQELTENQEQTIRERKIGQQQIKFILKEDGITNAEVAPLIEKYESFFFQTPYVICVHAPVEFYEENENVIHISDLGDHEISIIEESNLNQFLLTELSCSSVGISLVHTGLATLKKAYQQAIESRKRAFVISQNVIFDDETPKVAEGLRVNAQKLLEDQACTSRIHLIGTEKREELVLAWERFFTETKMGRISGEEFEMTMIGFLHEVKKIYKNSLSQEDIAFLDTCKKMYRFASLEEYEAALMDWILELNHRIRKESENYGTKAKMKQAIDYIQENFRKELNMATVSNVVSMNYSLFSFAFKEYVGMNFNSYLRMLRIKEAQRLLVETDMKIIDICEQVGYENDKHFMKVFKAECGVSATEYRRIFKK